MLTIGWYIIHVWCMLDARVRAEFSCLFPTSFQWTCSLDNITSHPCLIWCRYLVEARYGTTNWRFCFWKTVPPRIWIRGWAWHCPFTKSRLTLRDSLRRVFGEILYEVRSLTKRKNKWTFYLFSLVCISFYLILLMNLVPRITKTKCFPAIIT